MNGSRDGNSVFLMGIGGIGMANVAAILREAGFDVAGSDQGLYEPAATLLRNLGINPRMPYAAANVPGDCTPLIVGNAQSRGHVEVEAALDRDARMFSFPEFLMRHAIADRHRIVVAGTHGKSTTTALVAHLLTACGLDPGFLIGAMPVGMTCGGRLGSSPYFVLEGDEYDSAFFDKRSKFLHYFPRTLLLGPVEYDHADIFADLEAVLLSFRRLVRLLPAGGLLVYDADSANACTLAANAPCRTVSVGTAHGSDWQLEPSITDLVFRDDKSRRFSWRYPMPGLHNRKNALMAVAAVHSLLGDNNGLEAGVNSFRGLKRRMELLYSNAMLNVYDDFAHHPTAIEAALQAVCDAHPAARVVAVLEPRSNTMVRNIFQRELPLALSLANEVIIGDVHRADKIPQDQRLDFNAIRRELEKQNIPLTHVANPLIPGTLMAGLKSQPTVVIFMSNGSFGDVPRAFVELLTSQRESAQLVEI